MSIDDFSEEPPLTKSEIKQLRKLLVERRNEEWNRQRKAASGQCDEWNRLEWNRLDDINRRNMANWEDRGDE